MKPEVKRAIKQSMQLSIDWMVSTTCWGLIFIALSAIITKDLKYIAIFAAIYFVFQLSTCIIASACTIVEAMDSKPSIGTRIANRFFKED